MITKVKTSLRFAQFTDGDLSPFAGGVIDGLTNEAATFDDPPVPLTDLKARRKAFDDAMVVMTATGPNATAARNATRATLIDGLRKAPLRRDRGEQRPIHPS